MKKITVTGEYKGNIKKVELVMTEATSFSREEIIHQGQLGVSVLIFGERKSPPFYRHAWGKIPKIKWTVT